MKFLSKIWLALCLAIFGVLPMSAQVYTTDVFDGMQEVMDDAEVFFGVVIALAVLVTGFFLGRRWLRNVG